MFVHAPAVLAAFVGLAGFLLGRMAACPLLQRLHADLTYARHLAEHDPLTGLPNRVGAQRHHRVQVAAGRAPVAVMLDLDGFKAVNDTWGHQAGDAHLCAVATRLADGCRVIDAFAARLAGDEFLLLLTEARPDIALREVNAILTRLSAPLMLPVEGAATTTCTPGASAGIALPEPGNDFAEMLRHADVALYQAKTQRGQAVL